MTLRKWILLARLARAERELAAFEARAERLRRAAGAVDTPPGPAADVRVAAELVYSLRLALVGEDPCG